MNPKCQTRMHRAQPRQSCALPLYSPSRVSVGGTSPPVAVPPKAGMLALVRSPLSHGQAFSESLCMLTGGFVCGRVLWVQNMGLLLLLVSWFTTWQGCRQATDHQLGPWGYIWPAWGWGDAALFFPSSAVSESCTVTFLLSIKHQRARDCDGACGREVLPTSTWVLQGEMPAPCHLLEPCLGARDAEVLPGARHIVLRTHGPPQTPQCMVLPAEVATGNAPTLAVCLCLACPGPQSCPWTLRWALGGGPISPCHLDAGGKAWEDSKDGVV